MERIKFISKTKDEVQVLSEEEARKRVIFLEDEFQKLTDSIDDDTFYQLRKPIDTELSHIFDQFPGLKEWSDNR